MARLLVTPDAADQRFDRFLCRSLPHTPLSRIYRLIRTGDARINGKRAKQNTRLGAGDTVEVRIDEAEVARPGAQGGDPAALRDTPFYRRAFAVLYEDEALIACNKPSGLVVHPGSGHEGADTLIALAQAHLAGAGVEPLLVHRLDRDTSGLILIAKGRQSALRLSAALRSRELAKHYAAVVHGAPRPPEGTIELALARSFERNDGTKMRVAQDGQYSRSGYRLLSRGTAVSLLQVELFTGRTHQIRVHLRHIGCPIVGDVRYGDPAADQALFARAAGLRRLYLHAQRLSFSHPLSGERMTLEAPLPEAFGRLLRAAAPAPR